jgi:3'(2'), 5'-bisphosphate nucleotidase
LQALANEHGETNVISAGSSLKLCLVAEGQADIYPRFAPTMEWDIAAGQVIVEEAGGIVMNSEDHARMVYNKRDLTNSWFIAAASEDLVLPVR